MHTPFFFFFFNDTATTEIYTLSLHDALPISGAARRAVAARRPDVAAPPRRPRTAPRGDAGLLRLRQRRRTPPLGVGPLPRAGGRGAGLCRRWGSVDAVPRPRRHRGTRGGLTGGAGAHRASPGHRARGNQDHRAG